MTMSEIRIFKYLYVPFLTLHTQLDAIFYIAEHHKATCVAFLYCIRRMFQSFFPLSHRKARKIWDRCGSAMWFRNLGLQEDYRVPPSESNSSYFCEVGSVFFLLLKYGIKLRWSLTEGKGLISSLYFF